MGAWGIGPFENDDALDFVGDLADAESPIEVIEELLNSHAEVDPSELDDDFGCEIIALAAIFAARVPSTVFEDENESVRVMKAIQNATTPALRERVRQAALEVIRGERSELRLLWEETNEFQTWLNDAMQLAEQI